MSEWLPRDGYCFELLPGGQRCEFDSLVDPVVNNTIIDSEDDFLFNTLWGTDETYFRRLSYLSILSQGFLPY